MLEYKSFLMLILELAKTVVSLFGSTRCQACTIFTVSLPRGTTSLVLTMLRTAYSDVAALASPDLEFRHFGDVEGTAGETNEDNPF